jgi:hypothetical protein
MTAPRPARRPDLGSARDVLLTPALTNLMPVSGGGASVFMAATTAVIVVCGWLLLSQFAGAWRTETRDA